MIIIRHTRNKIWESHNGITRSVMPGVMKQIVVVVNKVFMKVYSSGK